MLKPKNVKFLNGNKELYQSFQKHHVIGHGNSFVFEVKNDEGETQCVKQIILDDKMNQFIYLKEIELLNKLKANPHPNIVEFKGSYTLIEKKTQGKAIKKGYIQMERGVTNLKSYLNQRKLPFDEEEITSFLGSMIEVFAHLQKIQVAHRDIKPSNILVFDEDPLYLKVCDVGAGTAVGECDNTKERTVIGTPYYLSPELYQAHTEKRNETNYKAYKSDVYSLGLLFVEFCLFKRIEDRLRNQQAQVRTKIKEIKDKYPNIIGLGKILRGMLEQEISKRMDFIELKAFVSQNNLLRNRIDKNISLSPEFSHKLSSESSIYLSGIDELNQLNAIVSTKSSISSLRIHIQPNINALKNKEKQLLEELSKIRHMKLVELQIDIEICDIEDKHIHLITDSLERNQKLTNLKLNFWKYTFNYILSNAITNESFLPLLKAINKSLFFLEELKLHFPSNRIKVDESYKGAFNFSNIPHLRLFELNLSFNRIPPEFFIFIAQDISESKFIEELSLNLQSIKCNPVHFNKAIKHLSSLQMMREFKLNVSSNSIRDEGMFGISDVLAKYTQLKTCELIMRSAEIQDKGFSEVMKSLGQISELKDLKLNFLSNQISEKGILKASPYFQNLVNLKSLNLNFANNSNITDAAIRQLSKSLLTVKSFIKLRIVLDSIDLSEKGCLYLGRLISQQPSLQQLEISVRHDDIKLAGIKCICAGIIKVKKIRKIKICCEATNIGDESANYLAMCLLKLRHLTNVDLNLDNCNLSAEAVENIIKTVKQCSKKAEEITINLRKNQQLKLELYEQIKKDLEGSRVAIRIDNPGTDILEKTSQSLIPIMIAEESSIKGT